MDAQQNEYLGKVLVCYPNPFLWIWGIRDAANDYENHSQQESQGVTFIISYCLGTSKLASTVRAKIIIIARTLKLFLEINFFEVLHLHLHSWIVSEIIQECSVITLYNSPWHSYNSPLHLHSWIVSELITK